MPVNIEDIEKIENKNVKLQLLLEAINDWRTAPLTLEEYFQSISRFLKIDLKAKKDILIQALQEKSFIVFAWEVESITILLELMDEDQTFDDLYLEIQGFLKKKLATLI